MVTILLLIPVLMATQCDVDDCDTQNDTQVEDLILLTPLQSTYNKGDELIIKVDIPSTNNYFGSDIDLFNTTNENTASLVLFSDTIFIDNTLTFIKGSQGEFQNWFNLPYNSQTEMYELEVKIVLDKVGDYMHFNGGEINFKESGPCVEYRINTNILWLTNGDVEFTVLE